jgi:hypothetical protein
MSKKCLMIVFGQVCGCILRVWCLTESASQGADLAMAGKLMKTGLPFNPICNVFFQVQRNINVAMHAGGHVGALVDLI